MYANAACRLAILSAVILATIGVAEPAAADDWYRWRGPNLNGISAETRWRDRWPDEGPAIAWKASVNTGFSSMSIANGRLYTMGNEDNADTVYCLDARTGDQLWTHSYQCPLDDNFFEGGPTSTPTVDAGHVYTLSRRGDVFCFEAATGKICWSKNLQQETEARIPAWGFSGSPLVHENLLVLNMGEAGTAVEKASGKLVWTSADRDAGYATPLPVRRGDSWSAVIASGRFYIAVDIVSGRELWRHRWLTRFGCNAADAIVTSDHLFLSSGYNRGAALLKMAGDELSVVWTNKDMQNQMNSCVLIDGFLYGIDGNASGNAQASLKCMELSTGAIQWSQAGIGLGSLMAAGGRLIVLSEHGELVIARASSQRFVPTARAQVLTGKCWTVPVLAGQRIYCRNAAGDLVCVDVRPIEPEEP